MSVTVALQNIRLEPCERWAHTQYSLEYHPSLLTRRGGYDGLEIDLLFFTDDGPVNWAERGRVTDMGHATYAADGADQRTARPCPFRDESEVWAFDPVAEYGLADFAQLVRYYENRVQQARTAAPRQLTTGGYYKTIVSGAIAVFGWEMLLLAAADPRKMERVWDGFFRYTLHHMQAWAATSAPVIIQHDDFVWTSGPFLAPDLYRQVIIPRYAELWKPLRAAGKKVLFCSDGDFREFAADVVAAGADGLIFEPVNDFTWMAERFGATTCLIGSHVDCRDLAADRWDVVPHNIDRTLQALRNCRGACFAVGNHLPPNIPQPMLDRFFDYLLPRLRR